MTADLDLQTIKTGLLEIAYLDSGPADGPVAILLHGWPDDILTFRKIAPAFNKAGYRTLMPYLRGVGKTKFLSSDTFRDGREVARAQDTIDFADALGVQQFAVVGHDWGSRIAYVLAALIPDRLTSITDMSVGYEPHGASPTPPFMQVQKFWYQWFMQTRQAEDAIARDKVGWGEAQWQTWSPAGWYTEAEFMATAKSFDNPDWTEVLLHSYRLRWNPDLPRDERYEPQLKIVKATGALCVPTLQIHGAADTCELPLMSEAKEKYFTNGYRRIVLDGVGHFPTREAPERVTEAVLQHLAATAAGRKAA